MTADFRENKIVLEMSTMRTQIKALKDMFGNREISWKIYQNCSECVTDERMENLVEK